jgi:hypothetical protein
MSDVKQFLDKDGLNALWNKTCSTFIPNRPSTKFYPFIGTASRGTSYKVTLPYNGVNVSYKVFMMNTMEIVLGSSYLSGATGKIFLSYYFTRDTNGTWLANDLRAFAIGCNVAPTITYQTNNPAIFWINLNSTSYNVISIKNLTAEDSAPSYDYRKTTIEAVTSVPTTGISSVPITILSNDGNKLKYNGNEIAVVNHTHDYLPLTGGTMTGPIVFNGTDSNRNIIRINNTTGDASKYGDFGFTLKYLGAGEGNHNGLGLYADNQSASSQILAAEWKQDGTLFSRSINPAISNTYTLGKSDYRWNEVHTKRIYADNLYESSQLLSDKYADKSYADYCSSYLHSANRAQFCNPAGVTIEYSTNGGSTWADYGASDEDKTALFSGCQKIQFKMGKGLSSLSSANDALRITMDASNMGLYTRCKCILLNVSENGNTNYRVKVETSLKGSPDTYTTIIENQRITGWSGWNRIPINNIAFGGGPNQSSNTGRIRLTFMTDGLNPVYGYTSGMHATVIDMEILGETYWSFPHTMAKTGHIYSWDAAGNTIFDKNVTANTFIGNLNGNATSANKASALLSVVNGNTTTSAGTGEIIYSRFQQDMLGSLPGDDNANGVITINTHGGDYHHQLGFTGSGMFYRRRHGSALNNSASWSKIAMTSDIPTDYTRVGDGTIYIYPHSTNEINFGGTNTADTIYFGYRPKDNNTTAPSKYVFGRDGAASVNANGFIKKDSSDSYVLLGGGGHKPVSDLTSQDHYKNIVSNINGITQTPAHGETFTVPNISVNANGHVINLGTTTIKLPTVESSGSSSSGVIPETIDNGFDVSVAPNTSKVIYGSSSPQRIELEKPKLGQVNEYMIFIINGELYTDEGEPDVEIYPPLGCNNLYWSDNDAPNLIQEYCAIEINIKVIPTYWSGDEDDYEIENCVAFGTYTIYPDYNE